MKKSLYLAGAFVGIIVGAGFCSGQEILQFFTNFGVYSIPAILIAMILFAFTGKQIAQLSSHLQATSHKQIIEVLCGKFCGQVLDVILSFFLFGVGVVMIAGAGSIAHQQYHVPIFAGSLAMTLSVIATMVLNVEKIIRIISAIPPLLFVIMIVIAGYTITSNGISLADVKRYSSVESAACSHWIMSALLYVSFNIAVGFSMLSVIGGTHINIKQAANGGIMGGVFLGALLLLINLGMMADLKHVQEVDLPTLYLANKISPMFGNLLSIILLSLINNSCVGIFYAFTVRFVPKGWFFPIAVVIIGVIGFGLSFAGFTVLVNTLYPIMGYVGFILLGAVIWAWLFPERHFFRVAEITIYLDDQKRV